MNIDKLTTAGSGFHHKGTDTIGYRIFHRALLIASALTGWSNFRLARLAMVVQTVVFAAIMGVQFTIFGGWWHLFFAACLFSIFAPHIGLMPVRFMWIRRMESVAERWTTSSEGFAISYDELRTIEVIIGDRLFFGCFQVGYTVIQILGVLVGAASWYLVTVPYWVALVAGDYWMTDFLPPGKTVWAKAFDKIRAVRLPSLLPAPSPVPAYVRP